MRFKKEIIDRLNFIKIKNFCSAKDSIKRIRRQVTDWEKIFAKDTFDTGPLPKKYKEHLKVNSKKTNNPILKWAKDLNRHLMKEDMQMANKQMKRFPTSHVIMEMEIKMTIRYTIHLLEWPKCRTLKHREKCVFPWNSYSLMVGTKHGTDTLEDSLEVFYKTKHTFFK